MTRLTCTIGPPRSCLRAYADSKGPDQSAHPRSLIRTFAVRLYIESLGTTERKPSASRKHTYRIFDPLRSLKLHIYIVKLGFTGVFIFFLFLLKNVDCGYSLAEAVLTSTHNLCFEQKYENYQNCRGGSNEYPQSMF